MDVLYIGSNEVCLTNSSFSKVYYYVEKHNINYDRLINLISGRKVAIFINSFFAFTEHRAFTRGITKSEMQSKINERLAKDDVIFATYNNLFPSGKGKEHTNDIVMTIIKAHDSEEHIQKFLRRCLETDLDLSHIYSFDQIVNTIGLSYSVLNHTININVVMVNDDAMIMASNITKFMLGRFIKKKEGEDIMVTTTKMLATTIKYIGTTYSFLKNDIKITIMSQKPVDIVQIQDSDNIFNDVQITTKLLKLPELKISRQVEAISNELQLLKLAIGNVSKVSNLTNNLLNVQIRVHKIIGWLKIFTILFIGACAVHVGFKILTGAKLTNNDKKISQQYDEITDTIEKKSKELVKYDRDVYAIVAKDLSKNVPDNSHLEILKDLSTIFKKHREFIFVEGYRFSCSECMSKTKRKNTLSMDIALFNVNESARFAVMKLANLEKDISEFLKKKYNSVVITFNELSKNKHKGAVKDVRDTMIIEFWNE